MSTIISLDLGGTNCRAGIVEYRSSHDSYQCLRDVSIKLSDTSSLSDLIHTLEDKLNMKMRDANAICIGAAGFYDGETLHLEGAYPYPMHFAKMAQTLKWPNFAVIHDYASIICATFTDYVNNNENISRLNSNTGDTYGRRVAFGLGTGLGLKDGILLKNGDFWLGKNEAGHIGVCSPPHVDVSIQQRHRALIDFMRVANDSNTLTFEKILTGSGLSRLYEFLYQKKLTPEEVGSEMSQHKTPELLDIFAWYLGLFIGTIQLSFMPEGGMWITGGVCMKHPELFSEPSLQRGIESSPAYLRERREYPLGIMHKPHHALLGAAYYAKMRLL